MNGLSLILAAVAGFGGAAIVHVCEHAAVVKRDHNIATLAHRLNRERQRSARLERELAAVRVGRHLVAVSS